MRLSPSKVLIEVILNNQCNKRCPYCDLDFKNVSLSRDQIDIFCDFLTHNEKSVEKFHINFFGGEPLLSFENLKYMIERIALPNITYSIGTNGLLLTKDILEYFKKKNVVIYLSIDNISGFQDFHRLEGYEDIIIVNSIQDPDFIHRSKEIFDIICSHGFHQINCMPVYTSKRWNTSALAGLLLLQKYIDATKVPVKYFSYYNGITSDTQFILDTDGYFYRDLDSLLWLQKQYKVLPESLRQEIQTMSRSHILSRNLTIKDLLAWYHIEDIVRMVLRIPRVVGTDTENAIIDKILQDGA